MLCSYLVILTSHPLNHPEQPQLLPWASSGFLFHIPSVQNLQAVAVRVGARQPEPVVGREAYQPALFRMCLPAHFYSEPYKKLALGADVCHCPLDCPWDLLWPRPWPF